MRTPHILVLVENLSVPFDRRVWQQSRALVEAGADVTVICPAGAGYDTESEVVIDGVRILRYPLRPATGGTLGYVREYALAMWHTMRLALKVRRERPIAVVHACNPPDLFFVIAMVLRLGGTRFVFDHHDLVPELFLSRFPGAGPNLYRLTRFFERLTFAAADAVISTNESYRQVAIERGKMAPDKVAVVRSAPELRNFAPRPPDGSLRRGKRHLLAYLGVMGPQDGVDCALRALRVLRYEIGRTDFHCIFMGSGDVFDEMVTLSAELGLSDFVEFPGRVSDELVQRCLSTADVCLSPDPLNPLNDVSTMNKVVEYMTMGRPLVSFDLQEARVSAGDAALYVPANDESAFARAIDTLLDDPELGRRMGEFGRRRVHEELSWDVSRRNLLAFYERLLDDQMPAAKGDSPRHKVQTTLSRVICSLILACSALLIGGSEGAASTGFVGDFETGNFDQWAICQNAQVGSITCSEFRAPDPSMQVQSTVVRQGHFAARFQLRQGDRPNGLCCGDRAEVSGEAQTAANEGDERWYQWSTLFGEDFPTNTGWSVLSQWHANSDGSPPVSIVSRQADPDQWSLYLSTWNAPGSPGPTFTPWSAPVVRGVWNDLKLHIKWSESDAIGFVELWLNGAPQTFTAAPCSGQTRCMVRTLMPGGGGVYFKQGYYRDPAIAATGSVYHDGFSQSLSESGLRPL